MIFLLLLDLFAPIKMINYGSQNLANPKFEFTWRGLRLENIRNLFQGIQYLHYGSFAIVLVCAYDNRVTQILINLILLFFFFLYIAAMMPPRETFWRFEQIAIHFLLLLAKILLTVLVIDDENVDLSGKKRWNIGMAIAIILFIIIVWNFLVLLIRLIMRLLACKKAKQEFYKVVGGDANVNTNVDVETGELFDKEENFPKMKQPNDNSHILHEIIPDFDDGETFGQFMKQPMKKVKNSMGKNEAKGIVANKLLSRGPGLPGNVQDYSTEKIIIIKKKQVVNDFRNIDRTNPEEAFKNLNPKDMMNDKALMYATGYQAKKKFNQVISKNEVKQENTLSFGKKNNKITNHLGVGLQENKNKIKSRKDQRVNETEDKIINKAKKLWS